MGANGAAEGKRKLMAFWGTIKEHDPKRHALRPSMPKDRTIPRWNHGDGVPRTKNDTMEISSWGSMLSKWMLFSGLGTAAWIAGSTVFFKRSLMYSVMKGHNNN